ncbi:hypothetical protein F5B22DRAFT_594009 [Xylaria bambusicola]|uniref:uncharacterized protein n=1 Tax=Xylaria bambusicola TaxID=326684 RepID=UPI0020073F4A|nr:uncharacterized protein F5B22DRAFT_594009 [Xylaria bambusicola]KAI0521771.1 hypothetical protein F5B22DRAFT_594009 [Xylaria bambusicola]
MDDGDDNHLAPPRLHIDPPLFNSANPWATTLEHLRDLYRCGATGAVTTRTALLGEHGFPHDDELHRFAFFESGTHRAGEGEADASLNNLGYSPVPLGAYLGYIRVIDEEEEGKKKNSGDEVVDGKGGGKPFIVSVTGSPDEVAECYARIARAAAKVSAVGTLAMEINLSCPNIPGKPPPAYDADALGVYLERVGRTAAGVMGEGGEDGNGRKRIPWGVKTPPYTHAGQFEMFVRALRDCAVPRGVAVSKREGGEGEGEGERVCPLSFVTATNTLGSCLLLETSEDIDGSGSGKGGPVLPGLGIGGLAGAPLHPLALGNVATLRRMLDENPATKHVAVLGIGGVDGVDGYRRMRSVGACAVGVGTALGIKGLGVFGEIERGLAGVWEV